MLRGVLVRATRQAGRAVIVRATRQAGRAVTLAAVLALPTAPALADAWYWSQSDATPYKVIGAVATDHCWLQGLGGKFMGTGEQVGVWHDATYWYLGGRSQQQDVHAYAVCLPRAKFTASAPDAVRWSSDDIRLAKGGGGCHSATKLAWKGDAMTSIARVSGALRGFGEQVQVRMADRGDLPSQLVTTTCKGTLDVTAHSLFVGKPGGTKTFTGASAAGTPHSGVEWSRWSDGDELMAPYDTSICFLTYLSGTFNGGGERVRIVGDTASKRWKLMVRHSSGQGVRARASCALFDQG